MSHSDTVDALKFVRRASRRLLTGVLKHAKVATDTESVHLGQLITAELNNRDVIFGLK